jgi:hypothetical protein
MNKQLQNKLKAYSALTAVAGLAASTADAQIVHTTVNYNGGYETYDIDIDGDGTNDFYLLGADWGANYGFTGNLVHIGVQGTNELVTYGTYYAAKLAAGVTLDSTTPFAVAGVWAGGAENGGAFGGFYSYTYYGYGPYSGSWGSFWAGQTGFVGVSFDISGATHYGWLRVTPSADFATWTLVDMAYNATPDEAIVTGQTLNVKENKRNMNVFADANTINIMTDGSLMNAKVDVVNMLGQTVANTVITSNTTSIANTFGSGIYIVRISDEKGKAITRKIKI